MSRNRSVPVQVVYSFNDKEDGAGPISELVEASDGYAYGVVGGGAHAVGVFYRFDTTGFLTVLYSFTRDSLGYAPKTKLIQASDGYFYGTTEAGGPRFVPIQGGPIGDGTIFRMSVDGERTVLHAFSGKDGSYPSGLVQAEDGCLYGTTRIGGLYSSPSRPDGLGCSNGYGTIFRLGPDNVLTTLHHFHSLDGHAPLSGLTEASDGHLYGTSLGGPYGWGIVFRLEASGCPTILHAFADRSDGRDLIAGLIEATDGNLYGVTYRGGVPSPGRRGYGTIFRMTLDGALTTLYAFNGQDGAGPSQLVQAKNGRLYGTTQHGGTKDRGTVFEITLDGSLTTLHNFTGRNGLIPYAGLTATKDGHLYGTTNMGGLKNKGTIFRVSLS